MNAGVIEEVDEEEEKLKQELLADRERDLELLRWQKEINEEDKKRENNVTFDTVTSGRSASKFDSSRVGHKA